jgi:8-oxo-dGTP pyrophosphatase MutT (NUDIX family)
VRTGADDGGVPSQDQPSVAAVRECHEETGLHVEMVELLTRRLYEYAYGTVDLHFYLCRPTDPLEPHTDLRGFRWQSVATLRALKFPDANVPVLDLLEQRARDHGT